MARSDAVRQVTDAALGRRHILARQILAEARDLVDEEVYRRWRIYMAAARSGFEEGSLDVAQLLLARPGGGVPAQLPLRPWW